MEMNFEKFELTRRIFIFDFSIGIGMIEVDDELNESVKFHSKDVFDEFKRMAVFDNFLDENFNVRKSKNNAGVVYKVTPKIPHKYSFCYEVGTNGISSTPTRNLTVSVLSDKERLNRFVHDMSISPFHQWGDGWYGWEMLYKAIHECGEVLRKARVFVYDKEKFGSYRCDILAMWDGTIRHALGKYSVRFNDKWYDKLDRGFAKVMKALGIVKLINRMQEKKVNSEFQKIYLRYPDVVNELVSDIDMYEWIKPCKEGGVDGTFIYNKYWKKASDMTAEEALPGLFKTAEENGKKSGGKPKKKKTASRVAKKEAHTGDEIPAENTSKPKKKRGRKKKRDVVVNIDVDLGRGRDVNVLTVKKVE